MSEEKLWDTSFHNIAFCCQDKLVQIKCDRTLKAYLLGKNIGSLEIADYILAAYKKQFNKKLAITRDSLAIEILGHTYTDSFASAVLKAKHMLPAGLYEKLKKVMNELKGHTSIIDCGERDIDSNRFIWDDLAPFHSIIYGLLGSMA